MNIPDRIPTGAVVGALALIPGCAREHAGLDVTIPPPVASRFLAHGSIVASGTIAAIDDQSSVSRAYRILAVVTVATDPLPTSGACGAPAANQGG